MARYEGPVRFRFKGDPELARQFMNLGRVYLGEVREQMQRGNLQQLQRTYRTQDDTVIAVYSGFGENHIDVFREEPELEPEVEIVGNFVTVPASEEALNGWGEPFFDGEGNPINPPLGTAGGPHNQTLLTWRQTAWVAKRFWQYDEQWPSGIAYGNVSWAGKTAQFDSVALSWFAEQRYRYWGFLFVSKTIYYNGYQLCNAKESVIGAAVSGGNLVVLSATHYNIGLLATWHYRPFKPDGYDNNDDYDLITNPDGWRVCSGDFQENYAREDARQPLIFSPDGRKAACSFVGSRTDYASPTLRRFVSDIRLKTYDIDSVGDQVTISILTDDPVEGSAASTFTHVWDPTGPRTETDTSETPASPIVSAYHEYDRRNNLVAFSMGNSSQYKQIAETFALGEETLREEQSASSPAVLGNSGTSFLQYDFFRERIGGNSITPGGVETSRYTDIRTTFIDGNIQLGYFLAISRVDIKSVGGPAVVTTKISVVGPGSVEVELFTADEFPPVPVWPMFIGLVPAPPHAPSDPNFSVSGSVDVPDENLSKNLGLPDENVDLGFEHYFVAHRNADDQIIVTAWVRWDTGTEVLFGSYDFITDGNLPALTKVQGTNQRHQNTGVI